MRKEFLLFSVLILSGLFIFGTNSINLVVQPNNAFVGANIQFTVQNPIPALIYRWDFGDGTPEQTGVTISHSFKEPKSYQVKCKTQMPLGQWIEKVETVVINDNRTVQIQGGPFIAGTEVNINTNNFVQNNVKWDFGDGTPVQTATKNTKHIFQNPGNYTVKAYDFGGNTTTAITAPITIIADNRQLVITPKPAMVAETVSFEAKNFTVNNLKWDFGDGTVQNGQKNITHKYSSQGNFTVKVYDASKTASTGVTESIHINPDNRQIRVSGNMAIYQPISFNAENFQSSNIEWDFGDGTKQNSAKSVNHTYNKMGQFKIIVKEIGANKPNVEKTVYINNDIRKIDVKPVSLFVGDFAEFKLQNVTVNSIDWQIGNIETKRNMPKTLRYQFLDPGDYEVVCKINGQTDMVKRLTIRENRLVKVNTRYLFENIDVEFETRNFKGSTVKWDFGDGVIQNGRKQISHKYKNAGNYTVNVYDFDGKSKKPLTLRIRVIPDRRKVLSVYEKAYTGTITEMKAEGFMNNSIKWDFGDGTTLVGSVNMKHIYRTPGIYTVKAIDFAGRGKKSIIKKVIVKRDTRQISIPQRIIAGVPIDLGLRGRLNGNYVWKFDDGTSGRGQSLASKIFNRVGVIKVVLTDSSKKEPPLTKLIKVIPDTRKLTLSVKTVLPNKRVTFNVKKFLGRKVSWDFGDGIKKITNTKKITHLYSKLGKYKVKVRDFGGKGKKLFEGDILVTDILPGFSIERLEFSFNNGKYYEIARKNQYKLGYKLRIKAVGSGILHGKIFLDGSVLGLFEIYLNGSNIGYLKNSDKPKLPLNELGMHKLSFEFTNYKFAGQKPFLRFFVSQGKRIYLKTPKDNSLLDSTKPVKLVWSKPYKYLDYEYSFSLIPFQFLNDNQIKWEKSESGNFTNIDLKNYKQKKFAYLLIRAINKEKVVKAVSQIYYFKIK